MKTNKNIALKRNLKGFTLVELLVVIAIIASLAGLSYGPIMRHLDSSARTEAISNGKQIFTGLTGYMASNDGVYPSDEKLVAAGLVAGPTSAIYFDLLIRGSHIDDDKYFYNKQGLKVLTATRANNNNGIVEAEECVWGYVEGLSASDTTFPVIFDSSLNGIDFLANAWKGKAIIIKADGGAKAMDIAFAPPLNPSDLAQVGPVNELVGTAQVSVTAGVVASAPRLVIKTP